MEARKEFTVNDGIRVQLSQLEEWKTKLNAMIYLDLFMWAIKDNVKAETGYDIVRGTSLDNYIANWKSKC